MPLVFRLFAAMFLAVFAAWSIMQAPSATAMALEMGAAAYHGDTQDLAHCEGCGSGTMDGKDAVLCHSICVPPVLPELADNLEIRATPRAAYVAAQFHPRAGRNLPPEPYPPRPALI